jgi:hypothetical protein
LLKSPKKKVATRIAVYDFETSQEKELNPGILEHQVAFVSLRWTCSDCEDHFIDHACKICTPKSQTSPLNRSKSWSWYMCNDPLAEFVHFVLNAFGPEHETILWAHNGGRFDSHFVMQILYRMKLTPKIVMTGLKIYDISVRMKGYSQLHFRDSYLVLQTPLDSLKKTFALDVDEKMFFPYLFCSRKNMHLNLSNLPFIDDYIPSTMKSEKHAKFMVCATFNKNFLIIIHLRNGMGQTTRTLSHFEIL